MSNLNKTLSETSLRLKDAENDFLLLKNWYSEVFDSNFTMDFHAHPQFEIMYCETGQFDFVYKNDEVSNVSGTVTVGNNCFILVNNGYYHRIANLYYSTKILNLEYFPARYRVNDDIKAPQLLKRFTVPIKDLFFVSSQLENIFSADQDFYIFVDNSNVLGIIREILRKTEEQNPDERALNIALLTNKLLLDIAHCSSPVGYKKTGIIHVDAAMTYINSNFIKKITYGKTIHAIITEKRIVQAKYLLAQSDADMNTIVSSCGFRSYEHMAYAFKRSESCSPSAYRKKSSSKTVRFFSPQGEVKLYIRKYKRKAEENK